MAGSCRFIPRMCPGWIEITSTVAPANRIALAGTTSSNNSNPSTASTAIRRPARGPFPRSISRSMGATPISISSSPVRAPPPRWGGAAKRQANAICETHRQASISLFGLILRQPRGEDHVGQDYGRDRCDDGGESAGVLRAGGGGAEQHAVEQVAEHARPHARRRVL